MTVETAQAGPLVALPSNFRVEVGQRGDQAANKLLQTAHQLGFTQLTHCQRLRLYFLQGNLTPEQLQQLARELLADPVTETFTIQQVVEEEADGAPSFILYPSSFIDVTLLPGVTDPAADNLVRAAHLLGIRELERAATGQRYLFDGELDSAELERLALELCANPVIQRFAIDRPITPPFFPYQAADETVEVVHLRVADKATLEAISAGRRLALNLAEMEAIQAYFQAEGRDPTDVELETLAQTWSEHCVHKTFKARIRYTGPSGADPASPVTTRVIDGLLNTYIRGATEKLAKPWIRSAFVDNAGIIAFDDHWDLAFKVETHNHPSALEPFGGANTGVGGVVRDVLGVSARPIANTDVLCFGPPDLPPEALPVGVLHPRRIADGVVHGIEDYGNKMGIPTVNGAIFYHPGYIANPLVYCGCLGLLPRDSHRSQARPGDLIVAIGGRTGRDGLRGATFSSMEMDAATSEVAGSAVQIGDPIQEKRVLEVVLRARDEELYSAITDCGAGGFSSAVGEMGSALGARVELDCAPLKYPGLRPWEIWLSEAQERMVLAVPPAKWERLRAICAGQDVEAVCIGRFEASGRLRIFYNGRLVGVLAMDFLHDGLPRREMVAEWQAATDDGRRTTDDGSPPQRLLALLAHPNIRSKEDVIRRYDHEVQGGTAVKPLVGAADHGPGDAAVLVPLDTTASRRRTTAEPRDNGQRSARAIALANGLCPSYGEIDPYAMTWAAVDEAMRNVVAVGADPDQVALLDNFCWGNPNLPDRLGALVRCAHGCYDAALAYGAPFISGKDSLNNEYTGADGRKHAIPGTLLISALAIVPDVARTVTMDLKQADSLLYIVGETRDEMPPQPVPNAQLHLRALHRAIAAGLVQACHDCSEGGIAVALAEMCLAGRLGADVELASAPAAIEAGARDSVILFSESLTRFIVEVRPKDAEAFEEYLTGVPHARIGQVTGTAVGQPQLRIRGCAGDMVVTLPVSELEAAWRGAGPVGDQRSPTTDRRPETAEAAPTNPVTLSPRHPVTLSPPRVLILHANGANRDREAALACEIAGGAAEIVHINQLLSRERCLLDYHMLVVPGGFSYGDDLGAGRLWALDLRHRLGADVERFVASGRPVLGICNGFQALVKAGLLGQVAAGAVRDRPQREPVTLSPPYLVTLSPNASARFECRWVYLQPNPDSPCLFTRGLDELIYCPVAHGEGRLALLNDDVAATLASQNLIALSYVDGEGRPATYPANPNGSASNIAGLTNPAGNVLGLMPHPEDHIFHWQHPRWRRGEAGMLGVKLYENGIRSA